MSTLTIDGLAYAYRRSGPRGAPPLLLVHGFTGRASSWREHLPAVAERFDVVAVDLPGHGRTPTSGAAHPLRVSVEETADDLAALLDRLELLPAHLLGYSLGARVALRIAIEHPDAVRRLVLESPSPGLAEPAERAARRADDEGLAGRIERDGIRAFVDEWQSQLLFASMAAQPAERRARLRRERMANDPAGLAASLRAAGQGRMEPLHDRLGNVRAPTLVIAGALDPVGRRRAEVVAKGIGGARLAVVPDAGHRPHFERPAVFRRLVLDFLLEEPA